MLRIESKQLSFHSVLYNKIPENHILKQIDMKLDFSFINDLLKDSYSEKMGRPAKEPELLCKLLFLEKLYKLSDERVIEDSSLNLAYMYFLRLNPEDELPDKSLLTKFRRHRLSDTSLDEIIIEIIRQCVVHGIIDSDTVSIDATHIEANTVKKIPERLMKHLVRDVVSKYNKESGNDTEFKVEMPDYKSIEDTNEAKQVMKTFLESTIDELEKLGTDELPKTQEAINRAKRIIDDEKFMAQKAVRSIVDEDARIGRKSKNQSFYGYKAEFMMTTTENLITSVHVADGAYVDGNETEKLIKNTLKSGIRIKEIYGDKAYFRKPILEMIESYHAIPYIPVSSVVYRIDESNFSYNKDSDEWTCICGNTSIDKKNYDRKINKQEQKGYRYYFEKGQCSNCPRKLECLGEKTKRKILKLSANVNDYYEYSQQQKDPVFNEKYKKRASIESKNSELKRFHGLDRARGYGLISVSFQAKLTAIAVNLKTIARIIA